MQNKKIHNKKTYRKLKTYKSLFSISFFMFLFFVSTAGLKAQNLFEPRIIIDSIIISGNNKTNRNVILRELKFNNNDTIFYDDIEQLLQKSKENLLNTPLFNFVEIDTTGTSDFHKNIKITVEERWYTWPILSLDPIDRNMNVWLKTKDISRINIGLGVEKYNFLGLNQKLSVKTTFGYGKNASISYTDMYLGNKRRHSLSFYASTINRKTIDYQIKEDKAQTIKLYDKYAISYNNASIAYKYRKKIYGSHLFLLNYKQYSIADTIFILNPEYLNGKDLKTSFFNLEYAYKYSKKDSRNYALVGNEFLFKINKHGLGIIKNSGINQLSFATEYANYTQIYKRIYFASKITAKKTFGNTDNFLFRTGLGYNDVLRGYEYYLINATGFALLNTDLKFQILKPGILSFNIKKVSKHKKINAGFKKFNKIPYAVYLNMFFDTGYADDISPTYSKDKNILVNSFLYSYGAGINIVTYYDVVLRFEYAVNNLKEGNFLLNFSAPF